MKRRYDWVIHYVANGVICECCGEVEQGFIPHACNAHTHGMNKFGHLDFQVVFCYPLEVIGYVLNTLCERVRSGEKFHAGQYVSGIFEDCLIRLSEFEEDGRKVLRAVFPDEKGFFPECGECDAKYRVQLLGTEELYQTLYQTRR